MAAVTTILMVAMTVISVGMQISAAQSARRRQARMKREAEERADQAKGFTFVTEGQSSPLPIFYGRNKIGGIRVYHALSSNYVFAEVNGNSKVFCPYINPDSRKVFSCDANGAITLVSGIPEPITDYYVFPRGGERWDAVQTTPSTFFSGVTDTLPKGDYAYYPKFTGAVPNELPPFPIFPVNDANGAMLSNQTGTKREYFTVEQALCFGTINDVVHVLVEGKDWDHPSFSETMRIVVHKSGGIADSLAIANHNRTGAKFTHAAHLTGVFKLNRDDPQFNGGAPEVQAIIEGTLVRTIIGSPGAYELSVSRSYTNNPAYCLLDYLTSSVYGLGLSVDKIDLSSFKKAADICDIPVSRFDSTLVNLKLEGEYWRRKGITRNYKLFECNLGLSSAKPVRDNVETLLETMGLAELVWSAGKYSLNLMHPIPVVEGATFNANDVGYFQATNEYKRWDGSAWIDDVVAHITDDDIVRAKDITFAWPGAQSRQNLVTVKFNNEAKGFSEDTATWPKRYSALHNQLLEEDGHVPLESESFETGVTDYYHALAKAEQRVRISRRSTNYQLTLLRKHSNLESGDLIRVASNVLGIPGEVLRIESTKVEDNGDVSIEAFTYNCLDLAWNAKDTEIVDIPNIYSTDIGQATNLRFVPVSNTIAGSSGTLYWDAADDSSVVDYTVMYTAEAVEYVNSATSWLELKRVKGTYVDLPTLVGGTFTLTVVANTSTRRAPFKSYYTGSGWPLLQVGVMPTRVGDKYSAALTIYRRDASIPATPTGGSYNFKSNSFLTLPSGWYSSKPSGAAQLYTSTTIAESDASLQDTALTWSAPRVAISDPNSVFLDKPLVGVVANEGSYDFTQANGNVVVIRNAVDVTSTCEFQVVQQVNCVVTVNSVGHYAVTGVSADSAFAVIAIKVGGEELLRTLTVSVLKAIDVRDLTPPPDITSINVTVGMTSVFIALPSAPSYSQGGGHYSTTMYYTTGSTLFADAKAMGEFIGTDHVVASTPNRTLKLWFKFKTKDGVESLNAFGPLNASTGYIEGTDLNPLILESLEIADGSIPTVKLADNAITADKVAANAITARKLAAGSIAVGTAAVADGAIVRAMIGSAAIDSVRIADAAIDSAKISNTLQSDNFNAGYAGWRLRKDLGSIEVSQLTVYDGNGNAILSSGGVPYSFVSGKPTSLSAINSTEGSKLSGIEAGATVGATWDGSLAGKPPDEALLNSKVIGNRNLVRSFRLWANSGSNWIYTGATDGEDGTALVIPSGSTWQASSSPAGLGLYPGMHLTISFRANPGALRRTLVVDLYPDSLPESSVLLDLGWKTYEFQWDIPGGTSQSDLDSAVLRFFAGPESSQVVVVDVKLESSLGRTPWMSHRLDSVNILNPITQGNASTYIDNAAIGSAQIGSIALVGTSNFSVKSSASGARMEMDSRVIKVFDTSGVLRVKLGDLSV